MIWQYRGLLFSGHWTPRAQTKFKFLTIIYYFKIIPLLMRSTNILNIPILRGALYGVTYHRGNFIDLP
jgi:hypothetical protein